MAQARPGQPPPPDAPGQKACRFPARQAASAAMPDCVHAPATATTPRKHRCAAPVQRPTAHRPDDGPASTADSLARSPSSPRRRSAAYTGAAPASRSARPDCPARDAAIAFRRFRAVEPAFLSSCPTASLRRAVPPKARQNPSRRTGLERGKAGKHATESGEYAVAMQCRDHSRIASVILKILCKYTVF